MPEMIMSGGEGRKPREKALITGAEANPLLDRCDPYLRLTPISETRPEHDVRGGIVGVQVDRLLVFHHRAIETAGPRTDEGERKTGHRIPGVESDSALRQLVGFGVVAFGKPYPSASGSTKCCSGEGGSL
jgi:hypothetical protein